MASPAYAPERGIPKEASAVTVMAAGAPRQIMKSVADRFFLLLTLLGGVNLFVGMFNFIPLLPLDGGHIAGALYEAVRRGTARLLGRPDPGYFDTAKLLPVAYVMAGVILLMSVVLIWADIVAPVQLN